MALSPNSGRWLQWHWKGQDAPGEARVTTANSGGDTIVCVKYRAEAVKSAEPLLKMSWNYKQR